MVLLEVASKLQALPCSGWLRSPVAPKRSLGDPTCRISQNDLQARSRRDDHHRYSQTQAELRKKFFFFHEHDWLE
jgi:hypothetical protein